MKARRAKAIFLGAVLAIACWVLVGQRAADPEITGKVTLKGTPPAEIPIQLDPVSARIYPKGLATRHYVVAPDGGGKATITSTFDGGKRIITHEFETSPAIVSAKDYPQMLKLEAALGKKSSKTFLLEASPNTVD